MFERYTERARRVIFFARYEASQYGSPYIETEHLLLGIMREDKLLVRQCLPLVTGDVIRKKVDALTPTRDKVSTSVDLPLTPASKRVLVEAGEESARLKHAQVGTEHLLLALLREESDTAARMLAELGVNLAETREKVAAWQREPSAELSLASRLRNLAEETIQIHGINRNAERVRSMVAHYQRFRWHWRQEVWLPHDLAVELATGEISFDISLAKDSAIFKLVKGGWPSDTCGVCDWKLYESTNLGHGTGYTNGRDWLCTECYEKFFANFKPGPSPLADMT